MKEDIVQVHFKITIPEEKWLAKLNRKYSELTFNMLSKYLIDEKTGNTLFELKGHAIKNFLEDLKKLLKPSDFTILHAGNNFLLVNVKTKDPWVLNALIKTELLLIYPLKVKQGKIQINAITNRKKIDKFLSVLEKKHIPFSITSIGKYKRGFILSERQRDILKRVYKEGYYEIPRKFNQKSLALKFNISPSALSENLRRIHRKLAEHYLNE